MEWNKTPQETWIHQLSSSVTYLSCWIVLHRYLLTLMTHKASISLFSIILFSCVASMTSEEGNYSHVSEVKLQLCQPTWNYSHVSKVKLQPCQPKRNYSHVSQHEITAMSVKWNYNVSQSEITAMSAKVKLQFTAMLASSEITAMSAKVKLQFTAMLALV